VVNRNVDHLSDSDNKPNLCLSICVIGQKIILVTEYETSILFPHSVANPELQDEAHLKTILK
jgi:hypothetical protein